MHVILFLLIVISASCRSADDPPTAAAVGRPRCCATAKHAAKAKDDACELARGRVPAALYKLRAAAPPLVVEGGIGQAAELAEWMEFCGYNGRMRVLAAIQSDPVDVEALRDTLLTFSPAATETGSP